MNGHSHAPLNLPPARTTIPFPPPPHRVKDRFGVRMIQQPAVDDETTCGTPEDVLAAFASVSRRINDLARELKCLGYFDDDNDGRPRAA